MTIISFVRNLIGTHEPSDQEVRQPFGRTSLLKPEESNSFVNKLPLRFWEYSSVKVVRDYCVSCCPCIHLINDNMPTTWVLNINNNKNIKRAQTEAIEDTIGEKFNTLRKSELWYFKLSPSFGINVRNTLLAVFLTSDPSFGISLDTSYCQSLFVFVININTKTSAYNSTE